MSKRKRVPMIMSTGDELQVVEATKDDYVLDSKEAELFMMDLELADLERLRTEVVPNLQRAVVEYHKAMKEWQSHSEDLQAYVEYLESVIEGIYDNE